MYRDKCADSLSNQDMKDIFLEMASSQNDKVTVEDLGLYFEALSHWQKFWNCRKSFILQRKEFMKCVAQILSDCHTSEKTGFGYA
jgi:hypothetical protein